MERYGLIGRNISYSFSKSYFTEKFLTEGINATYENFDIDQISEFLKIKNSETIKGYNVTIPYKTAIIPFLDQLDDHAAQIGAVNVIKRQENGSLSGHNSDFIGFLEAIKPYLKQNHKKALILGTGGASKAIKYALDQMEISHISVSRNKKINAITYAEVDELVLSKHQIIINCTPLGTFPEIEQMPPIPIHLVNANHLIFDLIYNPQQTKLMKRAEKQGATAINGLEMLKIQAEEAWRIWNSF